jgi:hypothetical protein
MPVMEPLGMAAGQSQQSGDRVFRDLHETGGGADPTAFVQVVDHISGFFLRYLGVE